MVLPKFDSSVQQIKYNVLKEVARLAFSKELLNHYDEIPAKLFPGPEAVFRCCNHKERAIVIERVKLACGGDYRNENIIQVIAPACDECPLGGYVVTGNCRGCIAHRCQSVCPKGAIHIDPITHSAQIDKTACVNCGLCAKACPYNAIIEYKRPCEVACKVNAISMDEHGVSKINNDKCIRCGACVTACPFGAIMDKSYILDAIEILQKSENGKNYPVVAVVAPAIATQFKYARLTQVVSGIKALGFSYVVEAALGADMVAYQEAVELKEKGFLTSSCCPVFVNYIEKYFPKLAGNISHNLSPQAHIAKYIKERDSKAKVIFIGPCIGKKMECQKPVERQYTELALTFDELLALFGAKEIDLATLPDSLLDDASYYGRIFARAGGLTEAVTQVLKEQKETDFVFRPIASDGISNLKPLLTKAQNGNCEFNFIEGMACEGGCIGGPGMISHTMRDRSEVEKYGKATSKQTISENIAEHQ